MLPRNIIGNVARFTFHSVTIPLIYSTIAMTVTIESIGDYWFVVAGAFVVLGLSYLVATLLHYCIPISNFQDFRALRIAATFPNIVALPILIFPSLFLTSFSRIFSFVCVPSGPGLQTIV